MGLLRKIYNTVVVPMSAPLDAQADRLGIKGGGPRKALKALLNSVRFSQSGSDRVRDVPENIVAIH